MGTGLFNRKEVGEKREKGENECVRQTESDRLQQREMCE